VVDDVAEPGPVRANSSAPESTSAASEVGSGAPSTCVVNAAALDADGSLVTGGALTAGFDGWGGCVVAVGRSVIATGSGASVARVVIGGGSVAVGAGTSGLSAGTSFPDTDVEVSNVDTARRTLSASDCGAPTGTPLADSGPGPATTLLVEMRVSSGDPSRSGVMLSASTPTRSRPTVAVVPMSIRPSVDVGS